MLKMLLSTLFYVNICLEKKKVKKKITLLSITEKNPLYIEVHTGLYPAPGVVVV